jgi:hypothetical protein
MIEELNFKTATIIDIRKESNIFHPLISQA